MRVILATGLIAIVACSNGDPTTSEATQQLGTCGDGVLDLSEQCDDGNTADSDGCSATCRLEAGFACRPGHLCQPVLCETRFGTTGTGSGSGGGAGTNEPVFLRGNYLEIGLDQNAAFGAHSPNGTEPTPMGWHERTNNGNGLGFVADPDASGWTAFHGDFFTPGTPEEGWGIEVPTATGVAIGNNNRNAPTDIPGSYQSPTCVTAGLCRDRGGASVQWDADAPFNGLQIGHKYTIVDGGVFIIVDVDITNVGATDLADIYYMRNVDPDNDISLSGSYTTTNTIVQQPGTPDASNTIALVSASQAATASTTASTVSLIANDARARVTYGGFSNRTPHDLYSGALGGTNVGDTLTSDIAIAVAFKFSLVAGEHTHLRYAYNLEADPNQSLQCSVPCGDGALDPEEQCDDGNKVDGDGCSSTCLVEPHYTCDLQPSVCTPICGDSILTGVETCDDANATGGDGCSASCLIELGWTCDSSTLPSACTTICGDGFQRGTEQCDDGNTTPGDGCSATCTSEPGWDCSEGCSPICGDGLVVGNEGCDDANLNGGDGCSEFCTVEFGWTCAGAASTCTPICGDGFHAGAETCDDGNAVSGDGCDATCQTEPGYTCTPPPSDARALAVIGDTCVTTCGDGVKAGAEQCDDGNLAVFDGCSPTCTVETGYACSGTPSHCSHTCGNGIVDGAETCDDGNHVDHDGCSAACQIETGYQCSGDPSTCAAVCGDGIRTGGEMCDDGNTTSGDGCSATCGVERGYSCAGVAPDTCMTHCGDGVTAGTEQCDDGNTVDHDGCSASCRIEDADGDGTPDALDNCPTVANGDQADSDRDGIGDACDLDANGDNIPDSYQISGGGCAVGGSSGGAGLLLAIAGVLATRRRRAAAVVGAAVACVSATAAADTGFSIERFRLAMDRDGVIGVESSHVQEHLAIDANLWFGYANDPLIVVDKSGTRQGALVTTRMTSNLTAAISLIDRFELGLDVPIIVDQSSSNGNSIDMLPTVKAGGFGDLRFVPKIAIVPEADFGVGLAIIPAFTVPSGGGVDYRGDHSVTFAPEAAVSKTIGDLRIAADLGYRMRKAQQLVNLTVDDEIFGQGGVAYRAHPVEVAGALAFATAAAHPFGSSAVTYAELLGSASIHPIDEVAVSIIGGVGLDRGFGTPDYRLVLAARIELDSLAAKKKPAVGTPDTAVSSR